MSKFAVWLQVKRVVALGTVFAAELQVTGGGSGYLSSTARQITDALRARGVFARPLGNVVYLMASPFTPAERCRSLLSMLIEVLNTR